MRTKIYLLIALSTLTATLFLFVLLKQSSEPLETPVSEVPATEIPTTEIPETLPEVTEAPVTPETEPVITETEDIRNAIYFDVPLDDDIQEHIYWQCEEYGIRPSIIIAMIERESEFDPEAIGDRGRGFGLLQVHPQWHRERMKRLGCTDLLDPYQNIDVAIDYLAELASNGASIEWVLMAYNGGPSYATEWRAKGVVSKYAREVLERADELDAELTDEQSSLKRFANFTSSLMDTK